MRTLVATLLILCQSAFGGWRVFWLPNATDEAVTAYRVWLVRPTQTIAVPIAEVVSTNAVLNPAALVTNEVHSVYITAVNTYGESQPSARVTFTNTVPVAGKSAPSVVKSVGVRYEVEP